MAGGGDLKEDNELSDCLNRLGYEVGSLQFLMRNNNDSILSESLLTPTVMENVTLTPLFPEDGKPETVERLYLHSFADNILTDVVKSQCIHPAEHPLLSSEHLRELQKVEADLMKKVDEMRHRYEESFLQIIHSSKL